MNNRLKSFKIHIKGVVQGVGFRPFIYNLAKKLKIKGYVTNTSDGVIIEAEGENIKEFISSIRTNPPPLSTIDVIEIKESKYKNFKDFSIINSIDYGSFTLVSPDVSVCDECLNEMFDPFDRRYLYPFINCTNCGPRYSITKKVPYDRPNTTMSVFRMCQSCLKEYNDPNSRRFHAQPNACPKCGPTLQIKIRDSELTQEERNPIEVAINLLRQGAIVAIKSLGGFHLCCNALNEKAVRRLREKKRRNNKPFALMAPTVEIVRQFCEISGDEEKLLKDKHRPIVLLKKKLEAKNLPDEIAPNNRYLGFMLPYTPLHYLLFFFPLNNNASQIPHFSALVMTSGNLSEEPIVIDNDEALIKLSEIADAFLMHNRDIFMRVDDSVIRMNSALSFIRRARGYTPEPILLNDEGPDVLGVGADIKNTFTLIKEKYAIVSQHIGDMENLETLNFFEETLKNLKDVYRAAPIAIAHDLHPDYFSTRWALKQGNVKKFGVQHHYAHIASVMAENNIKEKIIGVAFDGSGYGTDKKIWGSEFMICDLTGFERIAHFGYIPLPGGERAIKDCWRTALSLLYKSRLEHIYKDLETIGFLKKYKKEDIEKILKIAEHPTFSPSSSGAGRLFDGVAAILGICDRNTFEGEAALCLESAIMETDMCEIYPYMLIDKEKPFIIDFSDMISLIINDIRKGKDKGLISQKFHNTIVDVILRVVNLISEKTNIRKVALSGGVFQNRYLLEKTIKKLLDSGFKVYTNRKVPPNDAGISLGQAYILRKMLQTHQKSK